MLRKLSCAAAGGMSSVLIYAFWARYKGLDQEIWMIGLSSYMGACNRAKDQDPFECPCCGCTIGFGKWSRGRDRIVF